MNQKITNLLISSIAEANLKPGIKNDTIGEKMICLLAGGFLLMRSVKNFRKKPVLALQGIVASSMLIYRGTGLGSNVRAGDVVYAAKGKRKAISSSPSPSPLNCRTQYDYPLSRRK